MKLYIEPDWIRYVECEVCDSCEQELPASSCSSYTRILESFTFHADKQREGLALDGWFTCNKCHGDATETIEDHNFTEISKEFFLSAIQNALSVVAEEYDMAFEIETLGEADWQREHLVQDVDWDHINQRIETINSLCWISKHPHDAIRHARLAIAKAKGGE